MQKYIGFCRVMKGETVANECNAKHKTTSAKSILHQNLYKDEF